MAKYLLLVLAIGGMGWWGWSSVGAKPVAADPITVELVINGYPMSITTTAADVAALLREQLGAYNHLDVSPELTHSLKGGDIVTVTDKVGAATTPVLQENLKVALAPEPQPAPAQQQPAPKVRQELNVESKPKTQPAQPPAPEATTKADPIDKPDSEVYSGLATWYRHGDGLNTASRDFPMGTRLRVVAVNSGRTVDVVVNDYGPAVSTGVALDLNAPAFEALAPLGAGKIQIKYYKI